MLFLHYDCGMHLDKNKSLKFLHQRFDYKDENTFYYLFQRNNL